MLQSTLREHFSGLPGVRVLPPSSRYEDLGAFAALGQIEPAVDAKLVETGPFTAHEVPQTPQSGFTHFLDGAQRSWPVGYIGAGPMFLAHTSAGVHQRKDRQVLPPEADLYSGGLELYMPSLDGAPAPPGLECRVVGAAEGDSELSIAQRISNEISARREQRETEVARKFRHGVLLIDGGIGKVLEKLPADVPVVGVVKSHHKTYFASSERVQTVIGLKQGQRSTIFLRPPNKVQGKEAYSCYFRLFCAAAKGPLHGLIRVELPPTFEMMSKVDEICGWLLAERDPLSLPDSRYDRMLYPIRLVEQHLKARQPSDASIRAILGV